MGGDVEVNSAPGNGTSILTWIPLDQNDDTNQPEQPEN
jgi:hypothetical protein